MLTNDYLSIDMISWQERFRKERSEKNILGQQVLKLENALTQSNIKCHQIERSAIDLGINNVVNSNKKKKPFNREEEDFIQDLRTRNKSLQEEQKKLHSKLKGASLAVKKLKHQLSSLRLRKSSSARTKIGRSTSSSSSLVRSTRDDDSRLTVDEECEYFNGCNISVGNLDSDSEADLKHILNRLQQRLLNADEEIASLKEENRRLHREDYNSKDNEDIVPLPVTVDKSNELMRKVQELQSGMNMMEVQYSNLHSTSQAQLNVHRETRMKLSQCNAYITHLKTEIQNLSREKETWVENKAQIKDLVEENLLLEEKVAKLCELPFAQDDLSKGVDGDEDVQLQEIEKELAFYKSQIEVKEAKVGDLGEQNDVLSSRCIDLQSIIDHLQHGVDSDHNGIKNHALEGMFIGENAAADNISHSTDGRCGGFRVGESSTDTSLDPPNSEVRTLEALPRLIVLKRYNPMQDKIQSDSKTKEQSLKLVNNQLIVKVLACELLNEQKLKTMLTVDFFHFEIRGSNIVDGSSGSTTYQLEVLYKLAASDFSAAGDILFEFYAIEGSVRTELIGCCSLSFRSVLSGDKIHQLLIEAPNCKDTTLGFLFISSSTTTLIN